MQDVNAPPTAASMPARLLNRSIGKKILMSLSGLVLMAYVVGHLIGNLQIFVGQNALNAYALFLRSIGVWLSVIRAFLLAMLIIHVWFAIKLYFENRGARPIRYKRKVYQEATLSSRTMIWTGIGVFLFVVYHLLHFTFIITNPRYAHLEDALRRHDVYSMVILGFQNYIISAVYIVSVAIVGYHIVHASKSMFQTWGLNDTNFEKILRPVTVIFAWLIFLGYLSIPVAVLAGIVKLPEGVI
ncbi:MAG: succinate dehydrogenase cytochrome b subunit [candidate division Zixibacteria bacterium]|nr:succinate dehydrogenase cytochrome b subunit [candidate division Zixibacteria bacterium]NIR68037.1 succinate dehydrogenase cytochrome b subunit [candidate division Zixibacteria bacterium]NIS17546.1 succinate dehydrogenase cytochrome b subunit [candidate division Zixibacteria bacterium]NIS49252.1 succinate dehydrogenase cytochrome b subunit [candidate division Zixibacteria bacterium]NIT53849.1 succinate dehydrogenase cytochrome b subunit [candidate division Zixibacteria bacterium]